MPLSEVEQIVVVASGLLVTLFLGGSLLYWIDREWRRMDRPAEKGKELEAGVTKDERADAPPDA